MAELNRDLVLPLGTYAHILDRSKGHINVNVGPYKTTASETDVPVRWNGSVHERIQNMDQAIQPFVTAEEGHYVVLQNPSDDGKPPKEGTSSMAAMLQFGRKVNIPGPVSFPLWPGQTAGVIEGHHLRSNQYLVVRVYNDQQAQANWGKAVIKKAGGETGAAPTPAPAPTLVMGQMLVIKGTEVAFYIPPTGVEVVQDERGNFIREAATLERLEYSILLDEDGNKRYIQGPAVVFPKPTEAFVTKDGARKFRAIELSEISGIHVKVIAEYEEGDKKHKVGDELFITGKETAIYYPRPEHAIIKYDERELHHAVAIPEGDARYVLQRIGPNAGTVKIVRGPTMYLPDPRFEVVVKRILSPKEVNYLYPGNSEAAAHNQALQRKVEESGADYLVTSNAMPTAYMAAASASVERSSRSIAADAISRKNTYTPPRSITLNNKYDGVVNIQLWTGYALLLVSSSGRRRVVVGPAHVQLEYDEFPQAFELSTGKPKNTDQLLRTVYLKVHHNQVSDIIRVTTQDMVEVELKVSYRVDFTGEPSEKWFSVDNYVKLLCDRVRSRMKRVAKSYGIKEFYKDAISIVRDNILGEHKDGAKRPGLVFDENNMVVYDVEVLDVRITNAEISALLQQAQHEAVSDAIEMTNRERQLEVTRQAEKIAVETLTAKAATEQAAHTLRMAEHARKLVEDLEKIGNMHKAETAKIEAAAIEDEARMEALKDKQGDLNAIAAAELERVKAKEAHRLEMLSKESDIEINETVKKAAAVTPEMIATLTTFGQQDLAATMLEAIAPIALSQNVPALEYAKKIFKGTPFEALFDALSKKGTTRES